MLSVPTIVSRHPSSPISKQLPSRLIATVTVGSSNFGNV